MPTKNGIYPRGKYVLVKPEDPASRVNDFGIIIPQNIEQEQRAIGVTLQIGSDVEGISIGDKVLYGVYSGESVKQKEGTKEVEYKLIHDDDIIAFIR